MKEAIAILAVSVTIYLIVRRMSKDGKDRKIKQEPKKSIGFNIFSLRRKFRYFFRNLGDRVRKISFKRQKTEESKDKLAVKKKLKVDVDKSYLKAKELFNQGEKDMAEKVLLRLISIKPSDAKLYYLLHQIYLDQGNTDEAAMALAEATKRKQDGFWLMELADLYQKLNKRKLEEKTLEKAISMNNMIAMRWARLASVQMKLNEYDKANKSIRRALMIESNNENYRAMKKEIRKELKK